MKKLIFLFLVTACIISILLVFPITNSSAGEEMIIYVAVDGNDHNEGTKSSPFRTLEKAASEAVAGSTVLIRQGTYNEKLIVEHSGTKSKPIVFKPYDNEKVVLSGKGMSQDEEESSLVIIEDKNYITISGLTIQDLSTDLPDETVMGIYITGSSSHITLENNHVQRIETRAVDGNGHGIAIYGTEPMKDIHILHNTVEDLKLGSSESIVLNGNIDSFRVENNVVRHNNNIGIDLIGYEGVANNKELDYVRDGIVKDNQVYDISSYGNPAYGEDYSAGGIYVDGGKNITIDGNTIYNCDIGIEATSEHAGKYADHIQITNNIVYNNFYTGISIGGYDEERGGTIHSTISQNIMYRNDTKGLDGGQLQLQYDTRNNVIEKNIFTAGPSRIFIANYFSNNYDNELVKNVFHKEEKKKAVWIWKDEEYTSFPSFKHASNSDEKSSYVDPLYEDEENYNFKLRENSPVKEIFE